MLKTYPLAQRSKVARLIVFLSRIASSVSAPKGWAVTGLSVVVGQILKRIERVIDRGIAQLVGAFLELVIGFDAVLVLHHVLGIAHASAPSQKYGRGCATSAIARRISELRPPA